MNSALRWLRIGVAAPVIATLGCASEPRTARVGVSPDGYISNGVKYELRVGDPAPDFPFISDTEGLRRFSAIRSRVTAVVFDPHADWPACCDWQRLHSLLGKFSDPDIPPAIVVVGQSTAPCREALSRVPVTEIPSDRITFICDQNGWITGLFGANAAGRIFVVGNYGKISYIGNYSDCACLERGIATVVKAVGEHDYRYGAE